MPNHTKEFSGRWMVVGMFVFAAAAITVLWVYSSLHTAPFRPLQRALAEEFADSAPKVEGGQRKIHKQTPPILRIVMKVKFDPTEETDRAEKFADRVVAFAQQRHDLKQYDVVEIHFFQLVPESEIKQWTTERQVEFQPSLRD